MYISKSTVTHWSMCDEEQEQGAVTETKEGEGLEREGVSKIVQKTGRVLQLGKRHVQRF